MSSNNRPNILLIVSKDNGSHLGCYGDPFVETLHLDQLAAEGVRFTNAYKTQAVWKLGIPSLIGDESTISSIERPNPLLAASMNSCSLFFSRKC